MPSSPTLTSLRWQSVPQKRPSVCCQRWLDTISPMPYPPGTTSRCLATNGIRGSEESSDGTASTGRPLTSGGQQFRSTTPRPSAYTAPPGPSWTPTASVTRPARMSPTRRYAGGYAAVANQHNWSRSPEPFRGRCPRYSTPSRCCYDSGSHSTTDPCHSRRSRVLGPASDGEEVRACQRRVPSLYALEGFLLRLAASANSQDFILKGGVLLAAYQLRRPTADIDFAALKTPNDV